MLLINYDFYDVHALIIDIRSHPNKEFHIHALESILHYLKKPMEGNCIETNVIRSLIRPNAKNRKDTLKWIFTDNIYTANVRIVKDERLYEFLIAILTELVSAMKNKDMESIIALSDAVHNIPLALVDEVNPKKRILSEIKAYRKCLNNNFLCKELKKLL